MLLPHTRRVKSSETLNQLNSQQGACFDWLIDFVTNNQICKMGKLKGFEGALIKRFDKQTFTHILYFKLLHPNFSTKTFFFLEVACLLIVVWVPTLQ